MKSLYQSPFRVYLALLALALCGLFAGFQLPVSLFPNSTKPVVGVSISYPGMTAEQFFRSYGSSFEAQLQAITFEGHTVEKVTANYDNQRAEYDVEFKWQTPPQDAIQEVSVMATTFANQFPREIRDTLRVSSAAENTGFLAVSFFSTTRSLTELHDYLEPIAYPVEYPDCIFRIVAGVFTAVMPSSVWNAAIGV